jgi:tetratricopeptide (TPR) repeat protein
VPLLYNPALAFYNRGRLWLEQGDKDRAITDFKKALKIDPDFSRAYRIFSRLLGLKTEHRTIRDAKALEFFEKSQKNPEVN